MTKDLAQQTNTFLLNRQWTHSVAVTLNMKQAIKDPGGTWITLDEYRINQNLRHFLNLLNARYFGPNWRRKKKRLHVFAVWEKAERHHIHARIGNPNLSFETFKKLILECWERPISHTVRIMSSMTVTMAGLNIRQNIIPKKIMIYRFYGKTHTYQIRRRRTQFLRMIGSVRIRQNKGFIDETS